VGDPRCGTLGRTQYVAAALLNQKLKTAGFLNRFQFRQARREIYSIATKRCSQENTGFIVYYWEKAHRDKCN